MSDQSEELGTLSRMGQTAFQIFCQINMIKGFRNNRAKPSQSDMDKLNAEFNQVRCDLSEALFKDKPFVFTGTNADMAYFIQNDELPISLIKELPSELSEKVMYNFKMLDENGMVNISWGDKIIPTDEGMRAILQDDFLEFVKDTQGLGNYTSYQLDGTLEDIGIFANGKETLNLNELAQFDNKDLVDKITSNFKNLQKENLCEIKDNIVTITQKGKEFVNLPKFKNAITESGKLVNATATTTQQAVVNAHKIAQGVSKVGGATATGGVTLVFEAIGKAVKVAKLIANINNPEHGAGLTDAIGSSKISEGANKLNNVSTNATTLQLGKA